MRMKTEMEASWNFNCQPGGWEMGAFAGANALNLKLNGILAFWAGAAKIDHSNMLVFWSKIDQTYFAAIVFFENKCL